MQRVLRLCFYVNFLKRKLEGARKGGLTRRSVPSPEDEQSRVTSHVPARPPARPPAESKAPGQRSRTWLCWENTHEAREEAVHGSQHFGVSARHAGRDPPLQGFEAAQDGWRLEDSEQEAQHLQPRANVPIVDLIRLLLEWRTEATHG